MQYTGQYNLIRIPIVNLNIEDVVINPFSIDFTLIIISIHRLKDPGENNHFVVDKVKYWYICRFFGLRMCA